MSKITVIRANEERDIVSSLLKMYEMKGFKALVLEPSETVEETVIEAEDVEVTEEVTNYNELTLKDLRAIAKKRGFIGYSEMKKEQLIELLEKDDE